MATLLSLASGDGPLSRLDPVLEPDEQELRIIYTSERLRVWILNDLPNLETFFEDQEVSPQEQLDDLVATYAAGLPLIVGKDFKPFQRKQFMPLGDGVWYLKTSDLRIFGWFHTKDCFVGVVADTMERVKTHNLYQGYRGDVVQFRDALPLDEPKFIPGEDPDAILSNIDFS